MSARNMAAPRSSRSSRFAALIIAAAALVTLAFSSRQQHDRVQPSTFAVVSHGMAPISARRSAGCSNGVTSDRSDSPVACHARRIKSKAIKLNQGKIYLKFHKRELLTKKELRMRTTKVRLLRRADEMETERWLHDNPNSPKHQWSVVKTRQYMDANQVDTDERIREQYGIPLPPIRFMRDALNQMRQERLKAGSRTQQTRAPQDKAESDGKKEVAKAARPKSIDLTDINSEFMSYRGIAISKKKAQETAMRKKR